MFTLFKSDDSRDDRIRDTAQAAAQATRQLLTADTANMSAHELRGYVRARAERVVRSQIDARDLPQLGEIVERTVHLVVRELATHPIVTVPLPHIERRAA